MQPTFKTFYYSRKKLGAYLVFNIILLALAVLFTLTVFPDYPSAYYFALISCAVSLTGALFVFLARLPLAVIYSFDKYTLNSFDVLGLLLRFKSKPIYKMAFFYTDI